MTKAKCEPVQVSDGVYDGTWSGYNVKFQVGEVVFETTTIDIGIRGIDVPVNVIVHEGEVSVEVIVETKPLEARPAYVPPKDPVAAHKAALEVIADLTAKRLKDEERVAELTAQLKDVAGDVPLIELPLVQTNPAMMFDCEECGRENFVRCISKVFENKELTEILRESGQLDEFETPPKGLQAIGKMLPSKLQCGFCKKWYRTIPKVMIDEQAETENDEGD